MSTQPKPVRHSTLPNPPNIAVVIDLEWPFKHHHGIFAGTQEFIREHGWESSVWGYMPPGLSGWRGKRSSYDGIVGRVSPELYEAASSAGIPIVNVWSSSPVAERIPTVCQDESRAGEMAAEHLAARGLQQVAYIGLRGARFSKVQQSSFREAAIRAGLGFDQMTVSRSYIERPDARLKFHRKLREWLSAKKLPVGIYASSDMLARHVSNESKELGFHVPDQVAIIGTGNGPVICLSPPPSLSSIDYGFERVGYRACQLLADLIDGQPPPDKPILVPPSSLVARASTDAYPVEDEIVAKALRFMADQCHQPIKVRDISEAVHSSQRTLVRHFREVRGRSMTEELARIRISRVKRLLVSTNMPVKEIALTSGYTSVSRLCDCFRKAEGMTPGQFRDRHAGG